MVSVTQFVSDLFHINNHLCTPIYHARSHTGMDGLNSVAHEQRNAPIRRSERTLRATKREKYITVMWYQAKFQNFRAHCEAKMDRLMKDGAILTRESFDCEAYYLQQYPCNCCPAVEVAASSNNGAPLTAQS